MMWLIFLMVLILLLNYPLTLRVRLRQGRLAIYLVPLVTPASPGQLRLPFPAKKRRQSRRALTMAQVRALVGAVLPRLYWRRWRVFLTLGLGEADLTALAAGAAQTGLASAAAVLLSGSRGCGERPLSAVRPRFDSVGLGGELDFVVSITVGRIIGALIQYVKRSRKE